MAKAGSESRGSKAASGKSSSGSTNIFAYISFFVAALSLVASMYQGYLNTRYVELIQTSVQRAETARICKDLIDVYFQFKFKIANIAAAAEREKNPAAAAVVAAESEAGNLASRFGAYGTYLANFQGEDRRAEYTNLTRELVRLTGIARTTPANSADKLFDKADNLFGAMNADCVRSATARL